MEKDSTIILIVITGTLIMLILIIAIILFAVIYNRKIAERENEHYINLKNKELDLLRAVIDTQETERDKISRDLHDEVGPLLSTLKLMVTKHQRDLKNEKLDPEDMKKEREMIDVIMDSVRGVSHDLSPQFLIKYGLIKSLRQFVEGLEIKTSFSTNIKSEKIFGRLIEVNVYRVMMELINNVLKHDKPEELELKILKQNDSVVIELLHSGKGISNKDFVELSEDGTGIGLNSIKSRIIILNAELNYENAEKSRITLKVPLKYGKEH